MPSFISTAQTARIRQQFRNLEDTVKVVFWDVSWVAWVKVRPEDGDEDSWTGGTARETWHATGTIGTGRLRENGQGGPVVGENVIYQQAPYRLRTDVSPALDATMWLVVDGDRLFKVNGFTDRGGERQHGHAYLTEIFGEALPVEGA